MKKSVLINSEELGIGPVYEPVFRHEPTNARKTAACNWVTEETKAAIYRWLTKEPAMPSLRCDYEGHEFIGASPEDIEFAKNINAAAKKFIMIDPVKTVQNWLVADMITNAVINPDGTYSL